jgi:chromosome segregation ATPase
MRYLRALAVAAVVVPLVAGTGCVTKQTYDRDIQVERVKTVGATKERDQARIDLKKANDTIADLTRQVSNLAKVQDQLADERKHAESLEASIKAEVEKAKKAQEKADQAKLEKLTAASHTAATDLRKAHEQIALLKKEVETLRKETRTMTPPPAVPRAAPPAAPPVAPRMAPPMAPPAAPAAPER